MYERRSFMRIVASAILMVTIGVNENNDIITGVSIHSANTR